MRTLHSTFSLASQTVHQIAFEPATFTEADMLWLPHHQQLAHAARKRQAEHLAGRLAAAHALQQLGVSAVPGIGVNGEPLWQRGIVGSITHSGTLAMAVAVKDENSMVGIDCEALLTPHEAQEIKEGIINRAEEAILVQSGYPFALALTLAFSAKESLFKALYPTLKEYMGFDSASVTAVSGDFIDLMLIQPLGPYRHGQIFRLHWKTVAESVCTVMAKSCE